MIARRMQRKLRQLVLRSNKESIDSVTFVVAAGTNTTVILANAVNDYTGTVGDCPIGSKIKAVWIELSYSKAESVIGRLDWYLMKKPANISASTLIPGAVGGSPLRKFVFLERKGIAPGVAGLLEAGESSRMFAGWVMIPKRFQNMAEADEILIKIGASVIYNVCLKIIYKWYA